MPRAFSIDFSAVKTVPLGAPLLAEYPVVSFSNPIYEPPAKLPDNIKLESIIHLGDHTSVYHASGNFAFPSGQSEPVQLVVKFAPLRTLEMESSAYDILDEGSLTGKVTPVFLGMLLAAVPNNRGSLGCIITELWGSSLTTDFYELAKADKATILDKLVALHEIGILHLDFEPQNVLQLGGDFRIIDFGRVDLNHQCSPRRTRYNFSEAGEYLLEGGRDYLCNSVWHVALEMRLWERGKLWILGRSYEKTVYNLPLQHEIYAFPLPEDKQYFRLDPDLYHEWNLEFYLEVRRQRDRGLTLEELKSDENMAKLVDAADAAIAAAKISKEAQVET